MIASFGEPVAQEAAEVQAEANDNRPQGDVVAQPFQNLKAAPITMTFNVPGEFKNAFTGETMSSPFDITLAPGEYIVLTR